ncbi:MAG: hypothetical protein ABI333_23675 [bacterium]
MRPNPTPSTRGPANHGRLTFAIAAAVAGLILAPVAVQNAQACGDPEPDYGAETPTVEKSGNRKVVKLNFRRNEYSFAGGHRYFSEIQVFTNNTGLIKFLAKQGMDPAMWKALRKTADRSTCATLYSGKQLARLELALKNSVARHYLRHTRRSVGAIDLMLVTEQDRSGNADCLPPSPKARRARKR